ncbi:hypothetical protein V6N11_022086 [Hibiscus sabdariffa]|uniref:Zinc knuckle CX2CX4HX4C domain-containing protein n=1 Tax=Hibiscus sabdariffa TaxID=183260 RepID=A0ABR2TI47_9ROSI
MPEPPEDPLLPKKQQRRDEAPPDITSTNIPSTMDCDNPMLAAPDMNPLSYKYMLTGGSVNDPDDDLISLDDDDIGLLDEDVRIGEMDGLPITWYKRSLIAAIGERIGKVVKIDYQTDYGCPGRFVRMASKVNLRKPRVSKIVINGLLQVVEYESLSVVCFNCGIYGHNSDLYPCNMRDEDIVPPI